MEERTTVIGDWTVKLRLKDHVYSAVRNTDGVHIKQPIMSVTTFAESLFPAFDTPRAIASMGITSRVAKYGHMSDLEIARYWKQHKEYSALLGTTLHGAMEQWLGEIIAGKRKLLEVPTVFPPNIPSSYDGCVPPWLGDTGVIVNRDHLVDFSKYMMNKAIVPVAVEMPVIDPEHRMAGTVDALFVHPDTGKLMIYDWKRRTEYQTSNSFEDGLEYTPAEDLESCHASHALIQLNLYRELLENSMGDSTIISEMHIITIHPTLQTFIDSPVPINRSLGKELLEYRLLQLETEDIIS